MKFINIKIEIFSVNEFFFLLLKYNYSFYFQTRNLKIKKNKVLK
jgi:hypothetical protein